MRHSSPDPASSPAHADGVPAERRARVRDGPALIGIAGVGRLVAVSEAQLLPSVLRELEDNLRDPVDEVDVKISTSVAVANDTNPDPPGHSSSSR